LFELLAMLCLFPVQLFLAESMAFFDLEQNVSCFDHIVCEVGGNLEKSHSPVVLLFVHFL
jgi:hypothetical protein